VRVRAHARQQSDKQVACSIADRDVLDRAQENFLLDNPNYVTLDVKLFTGAVYYNDTSLAEWDLKPSTISMRDDKVPRCVYHSR
jgi:hypothetical protein